jgi:intracellular sulfur oxidation DsrE/DsrF family protein
MSMRTLVIVFLSLTVTAPLLAGDKVNVVYHLSEPEKAGFVLNNIHNHIKGAGGADRVKIVLVMHGPAIKAFNEIEAVDKIRDRVSELQGQGVELNVCGNTLKVMDIGMDELLPGMIEVSQGGVTRIAELQSQGYLYIRP